MDCFFLQDKLILLLLKLRLTHDVGHAVVPYAFISNIDPLQGNRKFPSGNNNLLSVNQYRQEAGPYRQNNKFHSRSYKIIPGISDNREGTHD